MTRQVVLFGAIAAAVLTAFACSSSSVDATGDGPDGGGPSSTPPPDSTSNPATEQPAGTGGNTGLPCDVEMVVENRCIACHSGDIAGVPKMLTYSDLMAKAASDPTKTVAQLSLERIKSTTNPMPPKPAEAPSADEISTWQAWADTGYAKGKACSDAPPLGDAGTTTTPTDAGGTLPDGGAICTSGKFWMEGNNGSALMNPGQVCQACHQVMGGPSMSIAGTVYPSLHEPNNCDGASSNALTVVITDAQNRTTQIPVNAAGNFYTRARIFAPFKAKVVGGGKERAMMTAQTAGDCNRCHTQQGANGAPGRITAP